MSSSEYLGDPSCRDAGDSWNTFAPSRLSLRQKLCLELPCQQSSCAVLNRVLLDELALLSHLRHSQHLLQLRMVVLIRKTPASQS
jgi:hypothetical protein